MKSLFSGSWNASIAALINSVFAALSCSFVGFSIRESRFAFSSITSISKAFSKFSDSLSADSPTVLSNIFLSYGVIRAFSLMILLAKEVKVSSSFAPKATFIISSFMEIVGLRSSGLVSDFFDFVTPTASTITK